MRVRDARTGKRTHRFSAGGEVWCLSWSPGSGLLAACGTHDSVLVWSVRRGGRARQFEGGTGTLRSVSWSPDGEQLVAGDDTGGVWMWNARTGGITRQFSAGSRRVMGVSWSPDGDLLASASGAAVVVCGSELGERVRRLEGHSDSVLCASWSPDGTLLASAGEDHVVRLWDWAAGRKGRLLRQLEGHTASVVAVGWPPTGDVLSSISQDGTERLWETDTWESVVTFGGGVPALLTLPAISGFPSRGSAHAALGPDGFDILELDYRALLGDAPAAGPPAHYANAKVVL